MAKKTVFTYSPVQAFEENTKKVIENGKKGGNGGDDVSKPNAAMQSDEEAVKRANARKVYAEKNAKKVELPFSPVGVSDITKNVPQEKKKETSARQFVENARVINDFLSGIDFTKLGSAQIYKMLEGANNKAASATFSGERMQAAYMAEVLKPLYEKKQYEDDTRYVRSCFGSENIYRVNGKNLELLPSISKELDSKIRLLNAEFSENPDNGYVLAELRRLKKMKEVAERYVKETEERLQQEVNSEKRTRLSSIKNDEDFQEKSKYDPTLVTGYFDHEADEVYSLINNARLSNGMKHQEMEMANEDLYKYTYVTNEEKAIFNAYCNDGRKDDAMLYLKTLDSELTARMYQDYKKESEWADKYWSELAKEHPWATNIMTLLETPIRSVESAGAVAKDLYNVVTGKPVNPYSEFHASGNKRNAVVSGTGELIENDNLRWAYNLGFSLVEQGINYAVFGGIGGSAAVTAGLPGAAGASLANTMTTIALASSSASDTIVYNKARGLSDEQAVGLGILTGLFEAITEKMALDEIVASPKNAFMKIFGPGLAEAGEEVTSGTLSTFADVLITGSDSEISKQINEYKKNGYSDAKAVMYAFLGNMSEEFLGGFIGGEIFAGVSGRLGLRENVPRNTEIKNDNSVRGDEVYYLIDEKFEEDYDKWVSKGKNDGVVLTVGRTSDALKSIGVKEQSVTWDTSNINRSLKEHSYLNDSIMKQIPSLIENPIIVMQSKKSDSRITMFGEVYDNDGLPIMAVLELAPTNRKGTAVLDVIKITSTHSRKSGNPNKPADITQTQSMIDTSDVLYVEPDKKRTDNWLVANRLQLPLHITNYGSIKSVTYPDGNVNTYDMQKPRNHNKNVDAFDEILAQGTNEYAEDAQKRIAEAQGESNDEVLTSIEDTSDSGASAVAPVSLAPEQQELKAKFEKTVSRMGYTVISEPRRSVPKRTIGYVDFKNKEIYISPEHFSESLLTHELTHVIDRGYDGKYVKSLISFFKERLAKDWNEKYDAVKTKYEGIAKENADFTYTESTLEAETLAEVCVMLSDEKYINMAKDMNVSTIKQIGLMFSYMASKIKMFFDDESSARKMKIASLKWQMALYKVTKKGTVTDSTLSDMFYDFVGIRKDGIEVYETSEKTKSKPYKERRKAFLEIMSNEYRGRTARFVKDGKKYYATFEEDDLQKNIYGDRKSDDKGRDAKLNVGADGGMFDLVENAKYVNSGSESGKKTKAHKDVVDWDYYEKTVQIDDVIYDVYINVRNKTSDSFVYSVHLRENTKIKAASPRRRIKKVSVKSGDSHLYDISVSQDDENSNKNISTNGDTLLSYAGEKAETANNSLYRRAVNMDKKGAAPNEIWKKTGWAKGQDGKWRFEIDDSKAVFSPRGMFRAGGEKEGTLPAYLRHNKLYRAYPFLRDIKVKIDNNLPVDERASYDTETKTIKINGKSSPERQLSSALHEAQHAIQIYEGFAKGASTDFWKRHPVYYPEKVERARKKVKSAEDKFRQVSNGEYYLRLAEEYYKSNLPLYHNTETQERLNEIEEIMEKAGIGDVLKEYTNARQWLHGAMYYARPEPHELYQNTAGEIESRDVQKRRSLSKEQRREKFPESFKEHPDTVFVEDYEEDTVANEYNESSKEMDVVGEIADTSALEEEISIIDEALKDESLPSTDRVALIKEKVRLKRQLNDGRDVHGEEDTPRTKGLEDAVDAYHESGDTSGIPTRRSVAASKKYYDAKALDIEAELKQIDETLSESENLSDMEYDELRNRRDALLTQWREVAKKNSVLSKVSDILDEIDTAARPNHTWVRDVAEWLADKKNLIKFGTYNLNDIERNFKIFFGKHFKTAYDKIIRPLYDSKKAYTEGVTEYADRLKKEIVDGLGIKKGSKESAAVMWLGEGQKPISKKDGTALEPYTYKDCVDEFGEGAAKRIQRATEIFREMYDELLDQVNETRSMLYPNNPDKLIPKREDYFRHFQEMSQGFEGLKNILQTNIGIDPMLVGVSENTKPKSKWQSFAQSRMGNRTTYDAVGGFLDYLPAAQYSIHIDPNIVNIRSLAYDLASAKASENGGSGNPNANGFIAYLQRYANSLAGKTTSHFDRAIQDSNFGRTAIAVVSWLNNKTKASAVLGNINSVLSQVTNIKNVIGKIEHQSDVVRGALEALASINPNSEIAARYDESGFLKERYLDRVFSQFDGGWDKVNPVKWAADLLGFADEIGTRITWNAAYNEAKRKGIKDAVQYADNFTRASVAGRGIGEEALIFKSQVAKMFLPFRTEVLNDLRVQQDILFGEEYDVWEKSYKKITPDMTEVERYKALKNRAVRVAQAKPLATENVTEEDVKKLETKYKSEAKTILLKLRDDFGVSKDYSNEDIELDFEFSKRSFGESITKQKKNYVEFAKMLSCFEEVVENAVGIEVHSDKYADTERADTTLKQSYVLASAFSDGSEVYPVKLLVKEFNDGKKSKLHVAIVPNKKEGTISIRTLHQEDATFRTPVPSIISLSQLLNIVNDEDLDKYIPKQFKSDKKQDAFDEIVAMGKKVDTSTVKRVKNIMQLYVAAMVVNAVIAAVKSDEFEPLEEAKEGYEENGLLGALLSVMEDYADGTGNTVAFDPIYDIVSGIYQGVNEGESAGGDIGKATLRSVQNLAGDLVSNNPFSTAVMGMIGFDNDASELLFNGNVYVPGGMGMPLASNVATVFRELGQGDYASAGAATVKPFLPLGTQIDRSAKGIYDWTRGYATTEAAYDRMAGQEGSLKYLIEKTPETFIKSLLFGPGAFSGESDVYYNDKTRKFTPEEQAEILSQPDYESRKVTFDDILAMNVYDNERNERKQKVADEFFLGKEGTVLYNLYISGEDAAVPYKNMAGDTSFTDSKTGKKYTLDLKADELERLTGEVSDKIASRFDHANESEVFASLSREEQVKYLESVANAEYKQAKIKALYDNGQMSYEDYFRLESNYMEAEAKRDRVLYVDDASVYVEFNAADTVGQYISYSDVPISEEGYEQLQKWRDYSSTRKPDNVDAELLRLSNATGSDINVSGNPYGIISYTKKGVEYKIAMPDNQIYALCDEVDKAVRSSLSSLFGKATYKNAVAEAQKDMAASVKSKVRASIKAKYKSKYKSVKVDEFDRIVNMR